MRTLSAVSLCKSTGCLAWESTEFTDRIRGSFVFAALSLPPYGYLVTLILRL